MDNEIEKIKKTVEDFFSKIGLETSIEVLPPKDLTYFVNIKTREPKTLIGERGEILLDIQRLLKAILKRTLKKEFYLDLDVNEYKKRKIKFLKELAKEIANEVALTKKEKILPPMPAYERRIIHLELAERGDVTTESVGVEPYRKIVIKPYP